MSFPLLLSHIHVLLIFLFTIVLFCTNMDHVPSSRSIKLSYKLYQLIIDHSTKQSYCINEMILSSRHSLHNFAIYGYKRRKTYVLAALMSVS